MAKFKPNDDQLKFINSNGHSVLVSASAGSGKTSTMINKLVSLMKNDRVPISNLLVVTYTNASASELKTKLSIELSNEISVSSDINDKQFLTKQLENLNNAEIGTLHSTCKKLIVKYFYNLGQSPDFALLVDKEKDYLLDLAVKNVFSKKIQENDDNFFEIYDCYNSKRNDTSLKQICLNLYNFKTSKPNYTDWVRRFISTSYESDWNSNIACEYLFQNYSAEFLSFAPRIYSLRKEACDLKLDRYLPFLDCRTQFIDEFCSAKSFEVATKVLFNVSFLSKPNKSKKMTAIELEFDEKVDSLSGQFSESIKRAKIDFCTSNKDDFIQSIQSSKRNLTTLLNVVDDIELEYTRLKTNRNCLDFNDLEDKMIELLKIDSIKNELRELYKFVFVDEYQDINEKQENILLSLVSSDNYYMIGDVKQSIYGFRQSSPKIFVSKYNTFGKNGNTGEVINFNKNYRSDKNILEFNNSVFEKIITTSTIGIDYLDSKFESDNVVTDTKVKLCLLNTADVSVDKEEYEAYVVAEQILDLLQKKKADGTNYNYSDIAVILRSRGTFVRTLQNVLTELKIPIRGAVKTNFFATYEVGLMLAILKCVSNFTDELASTIVLKNLFDLDEQDLMKIRTNSTETTFFECITKYSANDEISAKIGNFLQFIETSKKEMLTKTIKEFLTDVLNNFDILLKLKVSPNGSESISNVKEFLNLADNENYKFSVDKFLEYIEYISKTESMQMIGGGSNSVEICTIHHSKGLEYPAVIVAGMGKKFTVNKETSDIIINEKFGIGLKSIDSTNRTASDNVVKNAIKMYNKKSEIDEEIRLLYVALTRAKERLIMVGAYNVEDIDMSKQKSIYFSSCSLDLIFKSIKNVYLSSFKNKKSFVVNENSDDVFDVKIYSFEDFESPTEENDLPVNFSGEDKDLETKLKTLYCHLPSSKTATIKNTVTNILAEETDYENLNFVPKNLSPMDAVPSTDFLKLGTAYHSIMQNIKFTENEAEISKIIDDLIAKGDIDKNLKSEIKISDILEAIKILKDLILSADYVYREKQFLMQENYNKLVEFTDNNTRVIVQGVIDLCVIKGDDVYLIDYKTNRGVSEEDLINEYRLQLHIYSLAFYYATGKRVTKKYLYSFFLRKLIEVK